MSAEVVLGDCLETMAGMVDNSVDLIATDPPYFKMKNEPWDRQWDKPDQFIEWLGFVADGWARVLKPNGSLYCFASPKMAWRVVNTLRERFHVLNEIRWNKSEQHGRHSAICNDAQRLYFPAQETIFFCEHYGADSIAKGEAGYVSKCDELRGFVFEPLRAYLAEEWTAAGLTPKQANDATGSQMSGHYFTRVQWALPTAEKYQQLREYAERHGAAPNPLRREYEELRREYEELRREYEELRREYEELRREYEELRRPFYATKERPYTDTWEFKTVGARKGKHSCEKPLEMMEHIVLTSSRPGDLVFDPFAGSGTTGVAAIKHGRRFLGCETSAYWADASIKRIKGAA